MKNNIILYVLALCFISSVSFSQGYELWGWGRNKYGQLADGSNNNTKIPNQIGFGKDWKTISAVGDYTIAIKQDGTLWSWGNNQFGQLGDGTNVGKNYLTQIGTEYYWKFISAGGYHSTAIRQGRKLVTTNINNENEEKLHSNSNSNEIQLNPNPANSEVSISCNFDEEINNAKLKIYDMLGILVYEQNINSNTNTKQIISSINVTNFLNGTYNISIQSNNCMYHNVLKVLK